MKHSCPICEFQNDILVFARLQLASDLDTIYLYTKFQLKFKTYFTHIVHVDSNIKSENILISDSL